MKVEDKVRAFSSELNLYRGALGNILNELRLLEDSSTRAEYAAGIRRLISKYEFMFVANKGDKNE